ncbi:MAG: cation transporter [Oscillospiraceae bacterium]|nr:cation transporter [Oscillospiraceae bacterium]
MATAILCIALVVAVVFSIKSYARKMASGCCGGGDAPRREKVKDRDPKHYPYSAVLKISGMSCENCAVRVENALNSLDGVWAKVNLRTHTAQALLKTPMSGERLADPVCRAGYIVTDVFCSENFCGETKEKQP